MRPSARPFRSLLIAGALLIGAQAPAAIAQELQVDPGALSANGSVQPTTKRKGKKGADAAATQSGGSRPAAQPGGPNRQFGELEGRSPGKAPPKPKDKYDPATPSAPSGGKMPVGVSPSGNMSVGLPF
jgi:hypothetical protein